MDYFETIRKQKRDLGYMDLWEVYEHLWAESAAKPRHDKILTPKLFRMVLAGLGWTAKDFCDYSGMRTGTISLYLRGGKTQTYTLEHIGAHLVRIGKIEILDADAVRVK